MLFLAGADHERYEKAEWTRRQSPYVPPWSYTVSGLRWFRIDEKKRRLWKSKPPLHGRVKMHLRYDGFFLLPSCGSYVLYTFASYSISRYRAAISSVIGSS